MATFKCCIACCADYYFWNCANYTKEEKIREIKKNKAFIIIALLLTALAVYLVINNNSSTLSVEKTSFAVEDTAAITKLFLADKRGYTVTLNRVSATEWNVNGNFTARQDAINTLLATIKKVEMKAPIGIGTRENILKDLAARGIKVEIYTNDDEPDKVYYVGGPTPDNSGTYMALENDGDFSDPYITHIPAFNGYLTTRYIVLDYKWRSSAIFKSAYSEINSVKVEYFQKPEDSFEIIKSENGAIVLKSLKFNSPVANYDSITVKEYLVNYSNIHFEAFEKMKSETRDSILASPKFFSISLTDKNGKTNTVVAYPIKAKAGAVDLEGNPIDYDPDRMYAKINEEQDLALIQYFTFDKLMKPLSWFETDPKTKKKIVEKD
jgi:hypothetical protein